jgi:hypothetical protein
LALCAAAEPGYWLTPNARFYMLFRMYLPNIEVFNGQYDLPGVAKAK